MAVALVGFRGGGCIMRPGRNESAKQGFATPAGIMHELEKAEVERHPLCQ